MADPDRNTANRSALPPSTGECGTIPLMWIGVSGLGAVSLRETDWRRLYNVTWNLRRGMAPTETDVELGVAGITSSPERARQIFRMVDRGRPYWRPVSGGRC